MANISHDTKLQEIKASAAKLKQNIELIRASVSRIRKSARLLKVEVLRSRQRRNTMTCRYRTDKPMSFNTNLNVALLIKTSMSQQRHYVNS